MNYEQKYKEALSWMQSLYKWMGIAMKEDAEHYFPELTESEDERIRKELLYWLKSKDGQTLPIDKYNAAIAWLEKQSEDARNDSQIWQIANNSAKTWEQSFAILNAARKAYNKGKKDALKGQKPVEWKPIDTEYMDKLCEIIDEYDAETTTKCCWKNWLKFLKERVQLQPKQEWSEEDDKMFNSALWHVKNSCSNGSKNSGEFKVYNWLKSLKKRIL